MRLEVPSAQSVAATLIARDVDHLLVRGYAADGDGGEAIYARASPGDHVVLRDADGAAWRLDEAELHVAMFGARGDGRRDDTGAIRLALLAAAAMRRPVHFTPDADYRVFSGDDAEPLLDARGSEGIDLRFAGCRLVIDRCFEDVERRILFRLEDVRNVRTGPLMVLSEIQPPMEMNRRGVYAFAIYGECADLEFGPLTQIGGVAAVFMFRNADIEPPHRRTCRVRCSLIHTAHVAYPLTCGHSGDDLEAEVVADQAFHSFFAYGVENIRVRLTTRNHIGAAVILMAQNLPRRGMTDAPSIRDVNLEVTTLPASLDRRALFGGAQPVLTFAAQASGPVRMERIRVDLRVMAHDQFKEGALIDCPKLRPDDGGAPGFQDSELRGHVISDVRVGLLLLDGDANPPPLALFSTPEWRGETVQGVRLEPVRFSPQALCDSADGRRGLPTVASPAPPWPHVGWRTPSPGSPPWRRLTDLDAALLKGMREHARRGQARAQLFVDGRWRGELFFDHRGAPTLPEGTSADDIDVLWGVATLRPEPVPRDEGLAFQIDVSEHLDHAEARTNRPSPLMLLEDGIPLPGPHAAYADICITPGLYSHWDSALWFSCSDGGDPRSAGRSYATLLLLRWPGPYEQETVLQSEPSP